MKASFGQMAIPVFEEPGPVEQVSALNIQSVPVAAANIVAVVAVELNKEETAQMAALEIDQTVNVCVAVDRSLELDYLYNWRHYCKAPIGRFHVAHFVDSNNYYS